MGGTSHLYPSGRMTNGGSGRRHPLTHPSTDLRLFYARKKKTSLLAATMNVKPVETGGPKIGAKIDMALDEIVKAGDYPLR